MESTRRTLLANPRKNAKLFSILFYGWSIPIFKKGYSKTLDTEDVYEPLEKDRSNNLGDELERFVKKLRFYLACFL